MKRGKRHVSSLYSDQWPAIRTRSKSKFLEDERRVERNEEVKEEKKKLGNRQLACNLVFISPPLFWGKSWSCVMMLVLDQNSWMFRPFSLDTQLYLLSDCDPTSLNQDDDDLSSLSLSLSNTKYRPWWGSNLTETPRLRLTLFSHYFFLPLSLPFPFPSSGYYQPTLQFLSSLITKTRDQKIFVSWQCYESFRFFILAFTLSIRFIFSHFESN